MNKVSILGIEFDNYSLEEFKDRLINRLNNKVSTMVVTANPEIVMAANKDPKFMELIKKDADLVTADGIGIVLGGKMLKTPVKERVTGYDLFTWLLHVGNLRKLRVYLIGATPAVMKITKAKIAKDYPVVRQVKKTILSSTGEVVELVVGYKRCDYFSLSFSSTDYPGV